MRISLLSSEKLFADDRSEERENGTFHHSETSPNIISRFTETLNKYRRNFRFYPKSKANFFGSNLRWQ